MLMVSIMVRVLQRAADRLDLQPTTWIGSRSTGLAVDGRSGHKIIHRPVSVRSAELHAVVLVYLVVSSAKVPASALDGGLWTLEASHACMCSWPAAMLLG